MSVGVLIITHANIGNALLEAARNMLPNNTLHAHALEICHGCDVDTMRTQAIEAIQDLDQGQGVLILTDMYGSTPSNIASDLLQHHHAIAIAGINLPMLVRVMNYLEFDLEGIAAKAATGGQNGVFVFRKKQ